MFIVERARARVWQVVSTFTCMMVGGLVLFTVGLLILPNAFGASSRMDKAVAKWNIVVDDWTNTYEPNFAQWSFDVQFKAADGPETALQPLTTEPAPEGPVKSPTKEDSDGPAFKTEWPALLHRTAGSPVLLPEVTGVTTTQTARLTVTPHDGNGTAAPAFDVDVPVWTSATYYSVSESDCNDENGVWSTPCHDEDHGDRIVTMCDCYVYEVTDEFCFRVRERDFGSGVFEPDTRDLGGHTAAACYGSHIESITSFLSETPEDPFPMDGMLGELRSGYDPYVYFVMVGFPATALSILQTACCCMALGCCSMGWAVPCTFCAAIKPLDEDRHRGGYAPIRDDGWRSSNSRSSRRTPYYKPHESHGRVHAAPKPKNAKPGGARKGRGRKH